MQKQKGALVMLQLLRPVTGLEGTRRRAELRWLGFTEYEHHHATWSDAEADLLRFVLDNAPFYGDGQVGDKGEFS